METPLSGGVKVECCNGITKLIALRNFNPGDLITYFYGKSVPTQRSHTNKNYIFPHVPGRWSLDCSISPQDKPIRLSSVCSPSYNHGVAAYARIDNKNSNATTFRLDEEENLEAISHNCLEDINPMKRRSVLAAIKRIEIGNEIFRSESVKISDYIDAWEIDENQEKNPGLCSKKRLRGSTHKKDSPLKRIKPIAQ